MIGITLKLWPQDCVSRAEDKCCGPQAVMDARSVSHQLKIPYSWWMNQQIFSSTSFSILPKSTSGQDAQSLCHVQ